MTRSIRTTAKVVELGGAPASSAASGGDDGAEKAGISASAEVSAAPTAKSAKGKAPSFTPLEPPKLVYKVDRPLGVNPLDLDVIMLTAQFVAANGRPFLTGIANRESKNPQFDFLKPTHHLFKYFTELVDSY